MICPNCAAELLDDYTFCPLCGNRLPAEGDQNADVSAFEESGKITEPAGTSAAEPAAAYNAASPELTQTMPSSTFISEPHADIPKSRENDIFDAPAAPVIAPAPMRPGSLSAEAVRADRPYAAAPAVQTPAPAGTTGTKPVAPFIPKEYKPLTTAGTFWFFILTCIPVVGLICLLAFAFGGKNKNKKSLSRTILIYWFILLLILCAGFGVSFLLYRDLLINLFNGQNWIDLARFLSQTFLNS